MPAIIHKAVKKAYVLAEREPFFVIMLVVTAALSCVSKPHFQAIHWNVITTLFSLMLVCLAFERCRLLSSIAGFALGTFHTPRKLGFAMIFVTGILSMFVTNDVALLTVVPLTIAMSKMSGRDPFMLIILETMSANLISAATPFGNPQNLYLYSYFRIPPSDFFKMMLPFCLLGVLLLSVCNLLFSTGGAYAAQPAVFELYDKKLLAGATAAFIFNILSVLRLLDYRLAFCVTLAVFLILAPRLIAKVDYFLLLTFVLFFLFTDSVTGVPFIRSFFGAALDSKLSVLFLSAGLSQIISNVPAAVLISGFTEHARELLYGVSAGGLGTLVASLASLISYKLYIRHYRQGRYLRMFFLLNFCTLAIMLAAAALMEC